MWKWIANFNSVVREGLTWMVTFNERDYEVTHASILGKDIPDIGNSKSKVLEGEWATWHILGSGVNRAEQSERDGL